MPFADPPSARSTIAGSRTATSDSKSPFWDGGEKCIDDAPLLPQVCLWVRRLTLDTPARAARELARGDDRAIHDRRDLLEGHPEHIVEHERQSFRRLQLLEDDEQRQADRVGEHGVRPRVLRLHWLSRE
jgi:hypothetical protein